MENDEPCRFEHPTPGTEITEHTACKTCGQPATEHTVFPIAGLEPSAINSGQVTGS